MVTAGEFHSPGISVSNPALPPISWTLTLKSLFHPSWTKNIIRDRFSSKNLRSYPHRCQKWHLFLSSGHMYQKGRLTPVILRLLLQTEGHVQQNMNQEIIKVATGNLAPFIVTFGQQGKENFMVYLNPTKLLSPQPLSPRSEPKTKISLIL